MTEEQSTPESALHFGPIVEERGRREKFGPQELATVLSHYDLGVIERIREYPQGSRRAPKVRIWSQKGEYLLKRRAPGRNDPYDVAFAHRMQLHLAERDFPVAPLVGTRGEQNSMLQLHDHTYELFEFVHGERFDLSLKGAKRSGGALGRLHRLLDTFVPEYEPPVGSYHGLDMSARFDAMPDAVCAVEPNVNRKSLDATTDFLRKTYVDAAQRVESLGFAEWPLIIVHGDWHPGNLLYRDGRVVAVLDFDSARIEPRMTEIANAALQFAIRMSNPDDPLSWPEGVSGRRTRGLIQGYESGAEQQLQHVERQALPWLMIEALVVESVMPIARTGRFARIPGSIFLQMIEQKIRWLIPRADTLIAYLEE